jgi:hypothetical protein
MDRLFSRTTLFLLLMLSLLPMTGCNSTQEPAEEMSDRQAERLEEKVVGAWQHTKGPEVFELFENGQLAYTGRFKPREGRWTVEGGRVKVVIDSAGEKPVFIGEVQEDMLYLEGKGGTIELKRMER